ncbi:hypothetical protein [Ralstonia sp. GX3-BWBA]|uniref:hypothetical protein n=1 Tax=Ralstonia sp. GX3-BWBA TaxID=2219865 RepID=UPI0013A6F3CA|nr:hypothetical protein [Ralstonia sp. GX3-BWBA]
MSAITSTTKNTWRCGSTPEPSGARHQVRHTFALPAVPLYVHYRVDDHSPVLKAFLETLREVSGTSEDAVAAQPQSALASR